MSIGDWNPLKQSGILVLDFFERLNEFSLVVIAAKSSIPNLVMNEEAFENKDDNRDILDS